MCTISLAEQFNKYLILDYRCQSGMQIPLKDISIISVQRNTQKGSDQRLTYIYFDICLLK